MVFYLLIFQPFRGNPDYDKVADLPYDTSCLSSLANGMDKINIKDIAKCRLETMYNTTCMAIKMNGTKKVNGDTLSGCIAIGKKGSEN